MSKFNHSHLFWRAQRVLVTGGSGFLGSFVVQKLKNSGAGEIVVPRSTEFNLRETPEIERLIQQAKPTVIIHLAALAGGIGANQAAPATFFYDNAIMGIQLMEQARLARRSEEFVQIGTVVRLSLNSRRSLFARKISGLRLS